jgi:DNA-binding MarR family transcriptional regulator
MDQLLTENSFGYATRRAHRAFDRLLSSMLTEHGLSTGYWYYLRALWEEDGQSQRQLSQVTNTAENTTASIVAAMERDGLVLRTRPEEDRRRWVVSLTHRAQQLQPLLIPYAHQVNAIAADGLSTDDLETCLRVLERMAENLRAALQEDVT